MKERKSVKANKKYELTELKKDIENDGSNPQWQQLAAGIEYWKKNYLYPFGNISPIIDGDGKQGLLHDGHESFADINATAEKLMNQSAF